ncbi:uncharacterized protein CDV56_100974 [Aspergillus thermomutatus]|uniref:Fe2OG dioxygenase domain-containing protein n=1 Tax=Aspergillus thermomutatus TaxID=41047 RepID=A0A397FXJ1_ASPTH|nr:uncharacterized protein CDV56_100974 [Aspergillus thermomutatus]RHZ43471.1 hypothetical protein CDV56_100974 [Aspergillus thermomutatus]
MLRRWTGYSAQDPVKEDKFDPRVHLRYVPPQKKITMQELLLHPSPTASPVAGTTPFPLLSPRGVRAYRKALFQQEVMDNCASSPFPGTLVLRDAVKHSQFIREFWTHPETMRIVSDASGVPLEVVMPTEIGHTNIQVEGATISEMTRNLQVEPSGEKLDLSPEDKAYDPLKAKSSIIPWHYDSYPYVCVLMLSETDGMVGGETYIKKGNGEALKVEGPQIGHAVMLQGGEVEHLAARAKGVRERISTITSYRSRLPNVYDSSYLTNVRPYADLDSLYPEWAQYRLRKLRDEITHYLHKAEKKEDSSFQREELQSIIDQQIDYLQRTSRQMVSPAYRDQIQNKYGKGAYYDVLAIWETVQSLPEFERLASSTDQNRLWMPESAYWIDLQTSLETIQYAGILRRNATGGAALPKVSVSESFEAHRQWQLFTSSPGRVLQHPGAGLKLQPRHLNRNPSMKLPTGKGFTFALTSDLDLRQALLSGYEPHPVPR